MIPKEVIELLNSRFMLIGAVALNMWFTTYFVTNFAPYKTDEGAITTSLTTLTATTADLADLVRNIDKNDGKQDAQITNIKERLRDIHTALQALRNTKQK
jgi:hypothetical protein